MTLNQALFFKTYRIKNVSGTDNRRRRLLDMGFSPGANVVALSKAPYGNTLLVVLRDFTVALREDAAELIELEGDK